MTWSKGKLYIISGPSGAGKGTICKEVLRRKPELELSISATTRAPRATEIPGVSYLFVDKNKFLSMIKCGEFLEYSEHFENYYGTPKLPVEQKLNEGKDVILEIDVNGALQVKANRPDCVLIFIMPPNIQSLRDRLRERNTESDEVIEKRLQRAQFEISNTDKYDYIVMNDVLETAVQNVLKIMEDTKNDK